MDIRKDLIVFNDGVELVTLYQFGNKLGVERETLSDDFGDPDVEYYSLDSKDKLVNSLLKEFRAEDIYKIDPELEAELSKDLSFAHRKPVKGLSV